MIDVTEPAGGDVDVDTSAVGAATDGRSGAELRALVGEAVLHAAGGSVTTALLVTVARRDEAAHRLPGAHLSRRQTGMGAPPAAAEA